MRTLASIASVLLLAGCTTMQDGPQPQPAYLAELELAVPQQMATAGGNVPLTLTNAGGQAIGYNLCLGALERRVGNLWVPAPTDYKACSQSYATLAPGDEASGIAPIAAGLESDDYRYVTKVTDLDGEPAPNLLRSNPFHVEAVVAED